MSEPTIISVDYSALPTALLELAKQQMRVDFATDDDFIKNCLARAIDYFELYSGLRVFGSEAGWSPTVPATTDSVSVVALTVPLYPVSDFEVVDAAAADVKAEYELRSGTSLTKAPTFRRIDGAAIPAGLDVTLVLGLGVDLTKLPPAVVDRILRIAATLYHQREEIVIGATITQVPLWVNDLLVGAWVPRC